MSGPSSQHAPRTETNTIGAERRTEPRYNCPRLVRIRQVTVPENAFRLSLVQNVSAHGIGLVFANPFPPGTLLEIEVHGRSIVQRFARVIHSTKQEGGWLVGCTLNHSLSDAELERLLS